MNSRAAALAWSLTCLAAVLAGPAPHLSSSDLNQLSSGGQSFAASSDSSTNGGSAALGQFPWQALIELDASGICSGSVIHEEWVLTSAHCTDGFTKYVVTVGSVSKSGGAESSKKTITTSEGHYHPQFNTDFSDNDIGLVHLTEKLTFSDNVKAIRLPSYSQARTSLVGKQALTSGWGLVPNDDSSSNTLQYTTLAVADDATCFNTYGNQMLPNKICCSTHDARSPCEGDSGAPLVITDNDKNSILVGVLAFGSQDGCDVAAPMGYTKVTSFLGFIEATTGIRVGM